MECVAQHRLPAKTMIVNFFILSPRGDTVIAKTYRTQSGVGANERSHTEAFFRKVKFWDGVAPGTPGMDTTLGLGDRKLPSLEDDPDNGSASANSKDTKKQFGDAPPVFVMPDGYSYMHVKRNGLVFGCATEKNVSPVVVIEVRLLPLLDRAQFGWISRLLLVGISHSFSRRSPKYSKITAGRCPRNRFGRISSYSTNYWMNCWTMATRRSRRLRT